MTEIIKVKTGSKYEEIGSYSRVVTVDQWIFVSNTAGRNPDTNEIPENIFDQTNQVFKNIERALNAVGANLADVVASKVFIQQPEDVALIIEHIGQKFKGIDPATTVTCPPLGSKKYLVEVAVTAYRGASEINAERMTISP